MDNQKVPIWFWIIALLGLAWNIFGAVQFSGTVNKTAEHFLAMGMNSEQANLYSKLPVWMTLSFAVGVFGGVLGCVLLLFRKKNAYPVFVASLVGYVILYIGDIVLGVFAAFGTPQVVILTTVLVIAVGLLYFTSHARKLDQFS